jgi:hypothetical protein
MLPNHSRSRHRGSDQSLGGSKSSSGSSLRIVQRGRYFLSPLLVDSFTLPTLPRCAAIHFAL